MRSPSDDVYLGDGLYAAFDGYRIELYASDGIHKTNWVYLEPGKLEAFLRYVENLKEAHTKAIRAKAIRAVN